MFFCLQLFAYYQIQVQRISQPGRYQAHYENMMDYFRITLAHFDAINGVKEHYQTLYKISRDANGKFIDITMHLKKGAEWMYSPFNSAEDPFELKVLIAVGRRWLESGAANLELVDHNANIRALLYKIGAVSLEEENVQHANTVVMTKDVDPLIKELEYILCYLVRSNWNKMQPKGSSGIHEFQGQRPKS